MPTNKINQVELGGGYISVGIDRKKFNKDLTLLTTQLNRRNITLGNIGLGALATQVSSQYNFNQHKNKQSNIKRTDNGLGIVGTVGATAATTLLTTNKQLKKIEQQAQETSKVIQEKFDNIPININIEQIKEKIKDLLTEQELIIKSQTDTKRITEEIDNLNKQIEELNNQKLKIDSDTKKLEDIKNKIDELQKQSQDLLQIKTSSALNKIIELQKEIKQLQVESEDIKIKINNSGINEINSKIKKLQEDLTWFQEQKESIEITFNLNSEEVKDFSNTTLKKLNKQIDELQNKLNNLRAMKLPTMPAISTQTVETKTVIETKNIPEIKQSEIPKVPQIPEIKQSEIPKVPQIPEIKQSKVPKVPQIPKESLNNSKDIIKGFRESFGNIKKEALKDLGDLVPGMNGLGQKMATAMKNPIMLAIGAIVLAIYSAIKTIQIIKALVEPFRIVELTTKKIQSDWYSIKITMGRILLTALPISELLIIIEKTLYKIAIVFRKLQNYYAMLLRMSLGWKGMLLTVIQLIQGKNPFKNWELSTEKIMENLKWVQAEELFKAAQERNTGVYDVAAATKPLTLTEIADMLKNKVIEAFNYIKDLFKNAVAFINYIFKNIAEFFINLWNNIVNFIKNIFNDIKFTFIGLVDIIKNIFNSIWTEISDTFKNMKNGFISFTDSITNFLELIKNNINTIITSIITYFKDISDKIINIFKDMQNGFSLFTDKIGTLIDFIKNNFQKLFDIFKFLPVFGKLLSSNTALDNENKQLNNTDIIKVDNPILPTTSLNENKGNLLNISNMNDMNDIITLLGKIALNTAKNGIEPRSIMSR